jgi:hypothetical protein
MGRLALLTFFIITGAALSGCGAPPAAVPPTPGFTEQASPSPDPVRESSQTPTVVPSSPTTSATPFPMSTPEPVDSATDTPFVPSLEPTLPQSLTVTPTPTLDPNAAAIQIFVPGPMSKVSSPIDLRMFIAPRATGLTTVELFGEDGRLMSRKILRSVNYNNQFDKITVELPFETGAAAELGRLQISTKDAFGRLQALKSVHVMLLSLGASSVTLPDYLRESVALLEPPISHQETGGEVIIKGKMQVFNDLPVIVEIVDRKGQVLSSRVISAGPADGKYHEIDTSVPYQVTKYTPVRLVIRQSDDRIPGPFYLYSQEIFLNP